MLTRTTEDPCIGTSAPYINQNGNTITLTTGECEHSTVLVRTTPVSTMTPREFLYTAPFDITEDTYISAYNLRAGYKLGDDASGKLFEYENMNAHKYFFVEDGSGNSNTLSIKKDIVSSTTDAPTIDVYISSDETNWTLLGSTSTTALTATIPANGRLYLKAVADAWHGNWAGLGNLIYCSSNFKVGGNIMSLLFGDDFENNSSFTSLNEYAFRSLFKDSTYLKRADDLVLASNTCRGCYYSMFEGCTGLETAPELVSTSVTNSCYGRMFHTCSSLVTPPSLPATTMADGCYLQMFCNCTFTTAPALPARNLATQCYYAMFAGCSSLTTLPTLPATSLAERCYDTMFSGCSSVVSVPSNYLPATTLAVRCYNSMFYHCTSLVESPILYASKLNKERCYAFMFNGCTSLTKITCLATSITSDLNCTYAWTGGITQSGTFVKSYSMSGWTSGIDGIPSRWTVVNY